ncbi:hypothetical protein B0T16DRAFT_72595 [Cercophora newfieldiana]|uniref:Uncharacterized protein n=1 Tax=Cercophora newfieldiana TaxID=92897 RepID=A0AA40CTR1_9PEZI|nr:hypothetical protein B0T16DRAFT_72595 [Cercophora newfieldiana]
MSATRVSPAAALSTIWDPPCGANAFVTPGSGPTSCFPPNWSAYWGGDVGYYSPAICPSGFTPGCSKYASSGYQGPATVSGETAWLCVVSGYSCAPDSYTSYATAGISTRAMVQIRWKSSDLSILETHPLMPGRKFVDTPTEPIPPPTPTTPSPLPTSPVPVEDSGSGMSTAAKAGIGAGVGAAALLLCIAVIIFIRRHRSTHLHHHGPAEMQIEVGDPSPRDPFVPKPSEKSVTVMPINVATSPHSSLSPPEVRTQTS